MTRKKLYLITGFLGAGKTTFLRELIGLLADKKIAVIVNEFGEKGVDGALLAKEGIAVEEITNGSIFCVCRSDLFVDALVAALKTDTDVLLVETSGLSDPGGIGLILGMTEQAAGDGYDFAGTITLADATVFAKIEPAWLDELSESQRKISGNIVRHTLGVSKALFSIRPGTPETWLGGFAGDTYRVKGFVSLDTGWKLVNAVGGEITISACNPPPSGAGTAAESELVALSNKSAVLKKAEETLKELKWR